MTPSNLKDRVYNMYLAVRPVALWIWDTTSDLCSGIWTWYADRRDARRSVVVRQYRSTHAYQRDAKHMAVRGYVVASTTEHAQRIGCLRFVLFGWLALLFPPKAHITATYVKGQVDV